MILWNFGKSSQEGQCDPHVALLPPITAKRMDQVMRHSMARSDEQRAGFLPFLSRANSHQPNFSTKCHPLLQLNFNSSANPLEPGQVYLTSRIVIKLLLSKCYSRVQVEFIASYHNFKWPRVFRSQVVLSSSPNSPANQT